MEFKYLKQAELKTFNETQLDEYAEKKAAHEKGLLEASIKEAKDALKLELTESQKTEIEVQVKALELKQSVNPVEFKELKEQLAQIKESNLLFGSGNADNNILDAIEKGLVDFLPKVKEQAKAMGNNAYELEMIVKAPVTMTTGAISQPNATPISYVYQQVTSYADDVRAEEYIINYLSNGTTNKATIAYMDKQPTEGTMAITAEGALKPLISVSFVLRYSQARKMAGRTKISEEALDDIPFIMSIIRNELAYQHDIAVQSDIFTAVAGFAPAFVAGSLAASTDTPNNYDAIRAAIYAIKIASKGRYRPNAALIASSDMYAMGATKDTTKQYVFPPFAMPDGTTVSGVKLIEVADGVTVPAGTYIVGDWKKLHRELYKVFSIRIGQGIVGNATAANIVSDFESNMYTIIGESRYHLWIYENEKIAFIKSTFAATKTAIATA